VMELRTKELMERLVSCGSFPNMSASEGDELYDGIAELERDLADARKAAGWQSITPENPLRIGVMAAGFRMGKIIRFCIIDEDFDFESLGNWAARVHTHFRPINPPPPEEPIK